MNLASLKKVIGGKAAYTAKLLSYRVFLPSRSL